MFWKVHRASYTSVSEWKLSFAFGRWGKFIPTQIIHLSTEENFIHLVLFIQGFMLLNEILTGIIISSRQPSQDSKIYNRFCLLSRFSSYSDIVKHLIVNSIPLIHFLSSWRWRHFILLFSYSQFCQESSKHEEFLIIWWQDQVLEQIALIYFTKPALQ